MNLDVEIIEFEITESSLSESKRLDIFLAGKTNYSRTFIKKLFESNLIKSYSSNGDSTPIHLKKMPLIGTRIVIEIPPPTPLDLNPENIPLDILYEDEHLIFINKKAGLVVHPAPGNYSGTLVNALLHHCPDLKGIGGVQRPGIVHRLDKGTSGVMVAAKTNACHEGLILLFSKHDLERYYECLTLPKEISRTGKLESTIGRHPTNRQKMAVNVRNGKKAITYYKCLKETKFYNHLELKLETGRTHQIRVHLSSLLNCPILMDTTYGNPNNHLKHLSTELQSILKDYPHPLLHAKSLSFIHPITKKKLFLSSPPPSPFQEILDEKLN